MIKVKNLAFSYEKDDCILEDFNFSLKKGDRIALIGDNGCGKTTFFKLIMGLLKPDAGQIKIFGQKREKEEDFIEIRERIGYLFQDSDNQLFSPTVEEDIAFGPINLGKSKAEAKAIVAQKLALVKMEGFEKRLLIIYLKVRKK